MPARLVIEGGTPLRGEIEASAAKNAALPAMAASLLTAQPVVLENVPALVDVVTMRRLLEGLGAETSGGPGGATTLQVGRVACHEAPYNLVSTMRASVVVLGPLLARTGVARVALPGGCAIGVRPIDQHLKGLARLGADITIQNGYVEARASRLKGARITTDLVTVTGTENLMMAAVLAEGVTVLDNAAREPEVADLARLLTAMGARIEGAGSSAVTIMGVEHLNACEFRVPSDRLQAGTYLLAGAITGGDVTVTDINPETQTALVNKLRESGAEVEEGLHTVRVEATDAAGNIGVASVDFAVDTVSPTISINPVKSPTKDTDVTISGTRENGAKVAVSVDTPAVVGPISYRTATTWSCTIDSMVKGINTITATASDAAGNTASASKSIMVK